MGVDIVGLSHVAVQCRDLNRSLAFYRDTLGLGDYTALGGAPKISTGDGTFVEFFQADGSRTDGSGPLKHFSLTVRSVERAAAYLTAKGVAVRGPFTLNQDKPDLPTRIIAFVNGPDGEEIELVEPVGLGTAD
jgi:catechol 2,3-dioxygenase-like lactoylglutathione lyase family enzyme